MTTHTTDSSNSAQEVRFYFDVTCPFAWVTSRWIKEVEKVRNIKVTWVPMSLWVLNEGREELPTDYKEKMKAARLPALVMAQIATEAPEKLGDFYTALGTKIHNEGNKDFPALIDATKAELGIEAGGDPDAWEKALRTFHQGAIDAVGDEVGTPVVQFGDTAFFGPVITRIPRGEDAGELFDASVRLAQNPYFFELKRTRTESPQFDA
ncbi:DsbA family protein [Corynebacterium sp. 153RC1]|uniref:DsbA family protein n=1 Tax=unclassified Corynebacterium TaxID=2624378 RepID=UPI00211B9181|nr:MULTISPECIES: DsbA family protein [unclassified Corynebacterium]MCQ9371088.1 DsbA family protein [Corynebacterium sp. 35RC1]MCQ9353026.1 DsbA family protein [Corynebacterium sp. 209RC1]MCQ9355480.1 DsbA family protein [Corynebacterium sp. 1222RC1]MCQ9357141.1 DsbA family protein [Corynebacterium sp. 122RC1]MCQ9359715.1 DsbA family protein [Corynebacterium sp. 142RC1]